jgi:hypothetical protein
MGRVMRRPGRGCPKSGELNILNESNVMFLMQEFKLLGQ